ncbi:MAG: DUF2219 family protein [Rubellimicrobium sp.]|nr:DUF2219 family protein [Rubellimicrobium sp.]
MWRVLLGLVLSLATPALGEGWVTLGQGRLFSNDALGDGHDRWQTGSYTYALIRGEDWTGDLPPLGGIVEWRFASQIVAPMHVGSGGVDRPYAGRLSTGVHVHFGLGPFDGALGADLVMLGPQTGLARGQRALHRLFGLSGPFGTDHQIADTVRVAGVGEIALPLRVAPRVLLRPYAGVEAGVEDLARIGADVILGAVGQADLLVRDPVTGHLIRAVEGPQTGFSFVLGADRTQVGQSLYLPADQGFRAESERWRARVGVHWQAGDDISFFYGLTWLSPEFEGQDGAQVVGSLKASFAF